MKVGRVKKYFIFSKSSLQTTLAYRGQVFLWVFGAVINAVLMGLLWWAIYKFSPENAIGGYAFPQMLMYVVLSAVVGEVTYTSTMSEIVDDVRFGLIGMRLMKPISYRAQLGFMSFGSFIARFFIIGVPMTVVGTLTVVFGFGLTGIVWYNVLLFVPACLLSMLIGEAIDFLFGQFAFHTQAMFGVRSITNVLVGFLSGAMVPLSLFPAWAQTALGYTPFPSMISMPVRLFLGQLDLAEIAISFAISLAWIVALDAIGVLLYKTSVKKVVVFGG
ncbi:MAG: ABC-2 family transporter protein [Roseburia sp.]|nr:ABC-2 family transporter protein [Roseburia sp.]